VFKTLFAAERSRVVRKIEIKKAKLEPEFYLIKLKLTLVDNSILHVNEFLSEETFKYSYHWQDKKEKLKVRWDNSPHHKEVSTFPHHMHMRKKVKASSIHNLEKVLAWIEGKIQKTR
jgi:hypothetical protein